ncbi:MAG: radical SAM protein [Thermodesulfovibrio sp.]|nr:radical SAM protein [Thermodesulfovibrio sp.]
MDRKLRVLLVNSPSINQVTGGGPGFPVEYVKKHHPIGLLYVGTYVRDMGLADVKVLDFDPEINEDKYVSKLKDVVSIFRPDIVGINAFSFTLYDAYEVAKIVKSMDKNMVTVLGGIHTSLYPYEMINQEFIDFLVVGEGEETFADFLSKFGTDQMYYVKGMISKKKNGKYADIINNPPRELIQELDKIPFPDRNLLLDKSIYRNLLIPHMKETIMISSRGCPYSCAYCQVSGKKHRVRTPQNIVDEMEFVSDQGYNYVDFFDDTMNIRKERVKEVCREIIRRGLQKKLRWKFRGVANLIDEEMVSLMKDSGCDMVYIGIESGSDRVLKSVNRVITTEHCRKAVELMKKYGIKVMGYFMIGLPGESEEEINQTIEFALSLPLDYIQVGIYIPIPNTRLYNGALDEIGGDWFREYTKNPWKNCKFRLHITKVSEQRLIKLQKLFYRRFYMRPSFILRRIREGYNGLSFRVGLKFFLWSLS